MHAVSHHFQEVANLDPELILGAKIRKLIAKLLPCFDFYLRVCFLQCGVPGLDGERRITRNQFFCIMKIDDKCNIRIWKTEHLPVNRIDLPAVLTDILRGDGRPTSISCYAAGHLDS